MKQRLLSLFTLAFALAASAAEPAKKPTIVLISGEYEYHSAETLPVFKKFLEANYPLHCVYLARPVATNEQSIAGLEALATADLAVIFIRRMTLPEEQLARFRKFADAGKPIVGIRTASHSFQNWKEWDHDVLGGNYQMHYPGTLLPTIRVVPEAASHALLKGVLAEFKTSGSLYKNAPLPEGSVPLLTGTIEGKPTEPVAWTHSYKGGRVFYTSLGHPADFEVPAFQQLIVNAIYWGLGQPVPATTTSQPAKVKATMKRIGVEEFAKLVGEKQNVVLDVRTAQEFAEGHIPGALNLDVNAPDFAQKVAALDKEKTYLVHCALGRRSASACEKMAPLGFTTLYDLAPGFNAWTKAGKPVAR